MQPVTPSIHRKQNGEQGGGLLVFPTTTVDVPGSVTTSSREIEGQSDRSAARSKKFFDWRAPIKRFFSIGGLRSHHHSISLFLSVLAWLL